MKLNIEKYPLLISGDKYDKTGKDIGEADFGKQVISNY